MKDDKSTTFQEVKDDIVQFIDEREWKNFQEPKEVAISLSLEAGELLENFQWVNTPIEEIKADPKKMEDISDELADVIIYAMQLSNAFGLQLSECIRQKMEKNRKKYPANLVKGKHHKYTYYQSQNKVE
jgi:NTP pyrophosphatase (non-canonical NTP hydrolase)